MDDQTHILHEKKEKLEAILRRLGRVAVALSAGVDSTFLLKTAHDVLGEGVLAVTGRMISSPKRETDEAIRFCAETGIRQLVVDVDQMRIEGFADNPPERCYHCKKALFTAFLDAAAEAGYAHLCEGTNADDTAQYRPGLRALRELGVRSPLMEAGLGKQEIRQLSMQAGLATWDKPSMACLATRIPCGDAITPEKLAVIERAEQFLLDHGFRQVRVRMHGNLARIETEPADIPRIADPKFSQQISRYLHTLGFRYITLDLDGYSFGSMDHVEI